MEMMIFPFNDDTWDENFLDSLVEPEDANENGSDEEGDEPPLPTLKSYNEVIKSLEDVKDFLESRGFFNEAT